MIRHSQGKKKLSEEERQKQMEIGSKMKKVMENFLKIRKTWREKELTEENLASLLTYNTKILNISEDCPTVFNFRKDIFTEQIKLFASNLMGLKQKLINVVGKLKALEKDV